MFPFSACLLSPKININTFLKTEPVGYVFFFFLVIVPRSMGYVDGLGMGCETKEKG